MRTNYEEKTYEIYFNMELANYTKITFPLGQVQEGFLGFHQSAYLHDEDFLRIFQLPFLARQYAGVELRFIEEALGVRVIGLPKIKANLLFQYKKPDFMKASQSKEWDYWNKPYFRYEIYQDQQNLLNKIATKLGNEILIVYASPEARDIDELIQLKFNGKVISSSNFTKVSELNGHNRNTYIHAGTHSIACSEPKEIESLDLANEIEQLSDSDIYENQENQQVVANLSNQISDIVREDTFYGNAFERLTSGEYNFKNNKLLNSFFLMYIVRQLTGLQWLIII